MSFEPISLIVSTALSAAGSIVEANNRARLANYNAQVAQQNAASAQQEAAAEEDKQRRALQRSLAKQRTRIGSVGVAVEGSPLDLFEDLAAEAELDLLEIRRGGALRARDYALDASRSLFEAKAARGMGALSATGTVVAGARQVWPSAKELLTGDE